MNENANVEHLVFLLRLVTSGQTLLSSHISVRMWCVFSVLDHLCFWWKRGLANSIFPITCTFSKNLGKTKVFRLCCKSPVYHPFHSKPTRDYLKSQYFNVFLKKTFVYNPEEVISIDIFFYQNIGTWGNCFAVSQGVLNGLIYNSTDESKSSWSTEHFRRCVVHVAKRKSNPPPRHPFFKFRNGLVTITISLLTSRNDPLSFGGKERKRDPKTRNIDALVNDEFSRMESPQNQPSLLTQGDSFSPNLFRDLFL